MMQVATEFIFSTVIFIIASIIIIGTIIIFIWIHRKKSLNITEINLKGVIAQLPGHVYWKDINGTFIGSNTNNWKDFGLKSLHDYVGKTDYDILSKKEADQVRAIDNEVMQTGVSKIIEEAFTSAKGGNIYYLSHKIPLKNKNGEIVGILGVSIDVTAAKQETQDKLDMLENIIAVMPGTVYWMNRAGAYLGCNDNEAKSIGLASRKEIIGKTNVELLGFLVAQPFDSVNEKVMKTGEPIILEEYTVLQDGTEATVLSNKVALKNNRNEVTGMLGISVDITDKKRSEILKLALVNTAAQVSHDIRSPLAALNTVLRNLSTLPEDQRILIRNAVRRINDIANNLLVEYRDESKDGSIAIQKQEQTASPELISSLLDSLVSEKKLQIDEQNIELNLEVEPNAFGLFVVIDPVQFKRMISNLLNNAIEAMTEQGEIIVRLEKQQGQAHITLKDTGKGVPPDILEKIKQGGTTLNKEGGTGIGISSALALIEKCGGHFDMISKPNHGTTVVIDLPINPVPDWFQEQLILRPGTQLIVVDDDESIHAIWTSRCQSFLSHITLKHFHHSKALDEYCATADLSKTQFLVDYELLGSPESGLDLIERLNLSRHAILVTSRYEEPKVRTHADKLQVKIIPKNYSPYIPISLENNEKPKLIFIDDDKTLTSAWEAEAQYQGIFINTYNRTADFKKILSTLEKNTPIYIDSNLREAISGEVFAKELYEQGFTELYIASGHPKGYFGDLPWIKDFVSKEPPF